MALPRDFDLNALLRAGQNLWEKTPAGLAASLRTSVAPTSAPARRRTAAAGTTREPEGTSPRPGGTSAEPLGTLPKPDGAAPEPGGTPTKPDGSAPEPARTGPPPDGPAPEPAGCEAAPDYPAVDAAARFLDPAASRLRAAERLLELAEDHDVPLLERVRHLAAAAASLDAAFAGDDDTMVSARSAVARAVVFRHAYCFHHAVLPALVKAGIELVRWDDLRDPEKSALRTLFRELVYPVLTPLASVRTPPYVPPRALHLAVLVKDPASAAQALARIRIPSTLPRFVRVDADDRSARDVRLISVEDVIGAHLAKLFSGMQVLEHHPFRVTRGPAGRPALLEVEESVTPEVLDLLAGELGVAEGDIHRVPGPLDLAGLSHVAAMDRADLRDKPLVPVTHPDLVRAEGRGPGEFFAALRRGDILVHHPYDAFATSAEALIGNAAADRDVLAIKVILGGGDPRICAPLAAAADAGKQVIVVVGSERSGVRSGASSGARSGAPPAAADGRPVPAWLNALAAAGCQIADDRGARRVHCRVTIVVRADADAKVRRYCHLGTGDYRPAAYETGGEALREDLGLLTADREVGEDLCDLFNHLTGYSRPAGYRRLLVGPRSLRPGLVTLVEREIGHHRAGRPARVRVKSNAVTDEALVEALYRASRAGVAVDVWVRGTCVLRPQVPGLSETVRVRSVLGEIVEHSRVFAFDNAGDHEVWIGSADLVPAHLDGRVETFVRLVAAEHRRKVVDLFDSAMDGGTPGWDLAADGAWVRTGGSLRSGRAVMTP